MTVVKDKIDYKLLQKLYILTRTLLLFSFLYSLTPCFMWKVFKNNQTIYVLPDT